MFCLLVLTSTWSRLPVGWDTDTQLLMILKLSLFCILLVNVDYQYITSGKNWETTLVDWRPVTLENFSRPSVPVGNCWDIQFCSPCSYVLRFDSVKRVIVGLCGTHGFQAILVSSLYNICIFYWSVFLCFTCGGHWFSECISLVQCISFHNLNCSIKSTSSFILWLECIFQPYYTTLFSLHHLVLGFVP